MADINLNTQVDLLVKYIVKRPVKTPRIYSLYEQVVLNYSQNKDDKRIISIAFQHPWLIPYLDAGLVFIRPYSELRRRIYIVFSILEATPESSGQFLPTKTRFIGLLEIVFAGIRSVVRALVGVIVIKVGRL